MPPPGLASIAIEIVTGEPPVLEVVGPVVDAHLHRGSTRIGGDGGDRRVGAGVGRLSPMTNASEHETGHGRRDRWLRRRQQEEGRSGEPGSGLRGNRPDVAHARCARGAVAVTFTVKGVQQRPGSGSAASRCSPTTEAVPREVTT